MNKNRSPKKKTGRKKETFQIDPKRFKFRNIDDIYPEPIPQIKERHIELKPIINKDKKKDDCYELDEEFLFALVQPIFLLDKQKMNNTITKLIFNSSLITKLETDLEKKETLNSSINVFIKNLIFRRFEKDSILYRNGEIDDKFYFVIKGRISSLKTKKISFKISFDDYILYLIELKQKQEIFLLNNVLKLNNNLAPIKSYEEIKKLNRIIFKKRLEFLINSEDSELITDNTDLEKFFEEYNQDFEQYNMTRKELKKLLPNRGKILAGVLNREWDDYVLEHCKLTTDENLFFEAFEAIYKEEKVPFIRFTYEYNDEYIDSEYFGDFSLDEDKVIRMNTLRFEENTTLAFIGVDEYIDIISPQKKIEKKNDIMRLNSSFCFREISERIFKRNYYDMFIKKQCSRNSIIFNPESESNSLFFIKKGQLSLELNCSIIELQNLMQLIYNKLNNIPSQYDLYQKKFISKEKLKVLEFEYLNDPIFLNMKSHDKLFKIELEKKRHIQISVFSDFEMVGLEEVYLQIPHFAKAIVGGEKLFYNELPINKFKIILQNEMRLIKESYVQVSINRVLSLLKRLYNIKQNCIGMAKLRANSDSSNFLKIPKEPNIEYNLDFSNNRKLNINNNRTSIPQINLAANNKSSKDIKSEEKNKIVLNRKNKNSLVNRKSSVFVGHYIKSAQKIRNKKLILEINENNKERAKSGKFYDEKLNKNEDERRNKKFKKNEINVVIVGNRKININQLRREYNDYKLLLNDVDNSYKKELKTIDNIDEQKNLNLFEKNYNYIENQKSLNINKEKHNSIKTKILEKENLSTKIQESGTNKRKNNYSLLNMSNSNIINKYPNLINPIIPMYISPINPKIHNKKSTYLNLLQINSNENKSKIIKTMPNKKESENSKLNILPKIKLNRYLNNSPNSNNIGSTSSRNKFNGKIPDIVKNFYLQRKKKGCIPLIVNKRSNTLFLRKYYKKYNEN